MSIFYETSLTGYILLKRNRKYFFNAYIFVPEDLNRNFLDEPNKQWTQALNECYIYLHDHSFRILVWINIIRRF